MSNFLTPPSMLTLLGSLYLIYGVIVLFVLVRDGYWNKMLQNFILQLRIKYKIFLIMLISAIITIIFLDNSVSSFCKLNYSLILYNLLDLISTSGLGWFIGGILLFIALISRLLRYEQIAILCEIGLVSSTFAGIFNGVFKFIFNRERPAIGMDPWHFFHFFYTGANDYSTLLYAYNSMPSGHVISIVAGLTPLIIGFKNKYIGVILILWCILVAIARIYTLNHWLSDVIVSGFLGTIIGSVCYHNNKFRIKSTSI